MIFIREGYVLHSSVKGIVSNNFAIDLLYLYFCKNIQKLQVWITIDTILVQKLKDENAFWSYDNTSIETISVDELIGKVLIHLDIEYSSHFPN